MSENERNQRRIKQIATRQRATPVDPLGRACFVHGVEGRVDAAFVDLQAAIDVWLVDLGWFYAQNGRIDENSKDNRWYSVVLPDGAVLVAEHELEIQP